MKTEILKNEPNRTILEADFAQKETEFFPDNIEILSLENNEQNVENSHILPIKLKPNEARRAHEYQKTMLNFAYLQYKKSVGTSKESAMQKMYQEALQDYNLFLCIYEKELSD